MEGKRQELYGNIYNKLIEKEDKEMLEEAEKILNEEYYNDFCYSPNFYFRAPFLTLADDILELLKEGTVIEELHFLTGVYHKKKTHYE